MCLVLLKMKMYIETKFRCLTLKQNKTMDERIEIPYFKL